MFLDASAIIAIIALEDDAMDLAERLAQARAVWTSAVAVFEATAGLARIARTPAADALAVVERFLDEAKAGIVPIDGGTGRRAVTAFTRFGKGHHPAAPPVPAVAADGWRAATNKACAPKVRGGSRCLKRSRLRSGRRTAPRSCRPSAAVASP